MNKRKLTKQGTEIIKVNRFNKTIKTLKDLDGIDEVLLIGALFIPLDVAILFIK